MKKLIFLSLLFVSTLIIVCFFYGMWGFEQNVVELEELMNSYNVEKLDNYILSSAKIEIDILDTNYNDNYDKVKYNLMSSLTIVIRT